MPWALAVPAIISAGGGIVSSLLGKNKNTSTATPTFTPEGSQLNTDLYGQLQKRLADPMAGVEPMVQGTRSALRTNVNQNYNTLEGAIAGKAAQRGFGRSGVVGTNLQQLEMGRVNQFSGIESQIQDYLNNLRISERDRATNDAMNFLRLNSGSTGTQQMGSTAGNAISAGSEGLSFIMAMSSLMKRLPGGGGGGGIAAAGPGGMGDSGWGAGA